MKTIKKGTNKYYRVTCHGCDSDIEYQLSEAFSHTPMSSYLTTNRRGKTYSKPCEGLKMLYIKCPECGNLVCTGMLP